MMNHPPIPISELAEHTELLKANDNLKLSQEYEVGGPTIQTLPYSVDFCPIVFSLGGKKDSLLSHASSFEFFLFCLFCVCACCS